MKTQIIAIITTVLLIMATVDVQGQGINEQEIKKEILKEWRAKNKTTKKECNALEEDCAELEKTNEQVNFARDMSISASKASSKEESACKAQAAFDGSKGIFCNSTTVNTETRSDNNKQQISEELKNQIKTDLDNFIKATKNYNTIVQEWKKASIDRQKETEFIKRKELEKKENDLGLEVAKAANNAIGYGDKIIENTNVNQTLKNEVTNVENSIRKLEPADHLESLKEYLNCDNCILQK